MRFDNRNLFIKDADGFTKKFRNISGSAGLSYTASEKVMLKLNVARGFRAPAIQELSSNGAHEGTNRFEYGNRNLRSETSLQTDFGIEINKAHFLLRANTFYNYINDFIFYSKLRSSDNTDSLVESDGELIPAFKFSQNAATLTGFEILLDIHPHPLDWIHWENTFSYVRGRFEKAVEDSRNIPRIPAAHWNSEVRVVLLKENKHLQNLSLQFETEYFFKQKKVYTLYANETITPEYLLLNGGVSADFIRKGKKFFTVYFLAENISDVAYQNHLSRLKYTDINERTGRQGIFNMGRNFSFRIRMPLSFHPRKKQ
jgi:iron complex outermembrane receptor protein